MELRYRGVAYRAQVNDTTTSDWSGHKIRREEKSIKDSLQMPGEELIYRGVRYTR